MPPTPRPVLELRLGDRVRLARRHPCGGDEWQVVRLGADIGLVCAICSRRVLLERAQLERRLVGFIARGEQPPAGAPGQEPQLR